MSAGATEPFAIRLRRLRRLAGLSQSALAERAGLSADAVATLEQGRRATPRPETLARLALALGLVAAERDAFVASAVRPSSREPRPPPHIPHNLPSPLSSFVGRSADLARLRRFATAPLPGARLLTLVGPGGIGKTRLALEAARSLVADAWEPNDARADALVDGIWLVDLSALDDPALVPAIIASALGARESMQHSAATALIGAIGDRRLLLVVDNCEHVVDPCARLVDTLLKRCPHLRIMATSREALGMLGEVVWPVSALSLVEATVDPPRREQLTSSEAVQLFVERAAAASADFALGDDNAATVAAVCRQLDGIPLALELAAARLQALDLDTIVGRLSDRFRLLTSGNRTALPRHQTLHALVEWSYDLLTPQEQRLFARLGVFAGGWTLAAAEAVAATEEARHESTLALLARLVDKSLVVRETSKGGQPRYRMLETLGQFARQRLDAAGETALFRERHARQYLAWMEGIEPRIEGPEQLACLDRLEQDVDNLRTALDWCVETDVAAEAFRVSWCLAILAWLRGHLDETDGRLRALLALPSAASAPAALRGKAALSAGFVAFYRGQLDSAHVLTEEAVHTFRRLDLPRELGRALVMFGLVVDEEGDSERGGSCLLEALDRFRELGDDFWAARAATNLGRNLRRRGHYPEAERHLHEALAIRRRLGDVRGVANSLHHLADVREANGDYRLARATTEEALTLARSIGDRFVTVLALIALGRQEFALGDRPRAASYLDDAMTVARRDGFGHELAQIAIYRALIARDAGDLARSRAFADEGLQRARSDGRKGEVARALYLVGDLADRGGQTDQARSCFRDSLRIYQQVGDPSGIALALASLARVSEPRDRAARLGGAAEILADHPPRVARHIDAWEVKEARARLGAFDRACRASAAWQDGRSVPLDAILADALARATA